MRHFKWMMALALVCGSVAASAQDTTTAAEARKMMRSIGGGGLEGDALARAIAEAEKFPLGSKENPVRVNMPAGEHAYLRKLRCSDRNAPKYFRQGSVGAGPYGYIMDHYSATCRGQAAVEIYMDMYHDGAETRPVPGFTIAG